MEDAIAIMIACPMAELPDNTLNKHNIGYILDDTITPKPEHKLNVLKQLSNTLDSYEPLTTLELLLKITNIKKSDDCVELLSDIRQRIALNLFEVEDKNYHILRIMFETVFTEERNDQACDKVIKILTPTQLSVALNATIDSISKNDTPIFSRVLMDRYKNNERFSRKVKLTSLELYEELEKHTSY